MSIGYRGQDDLQGIRIFWTGQIEIIFEQLDGLLTHGSENRRQVLDIIHTDIGIVVPILVVAFIAVSAYKASAMQQVVFWIVLNHGTHIVEFIVLPIVFHGLARCIGSAEDAYGL